MDYPCRVSAETIAYFQHLESCPRLRYNCEDCGWLLSNRDMDNLATLCRLCQPCSEGCGRTRHPASENVCCAHCEVEGCREEYARCGDDELREELRRWEQRAQEAHEQHGHETTGVRA